MTEPAPPTPEELALHAAQEYVRFLVEHHAAPSVSAGLTPTYAINLSRLKAACAALAPPPSAEAVCPWAMPLDTPCPKHGGPLGECPVDDGPPTRLRAAPGPMTSADPSASIAATDTRSGGDRGGMAPRYLVSPDGRQLTCLECGADTRAPLDVAQRYCAHCRQFLEREGQRDGVD